MRKTMGPSCHGLLIYSIFLLTIWLLSVLLPLMGNVIYNQFQQIPYALGWKNKWYFITHCRRVSSSPDLHIVWFGGGGFFLALSAAHQLGHWGSSWWSCRRLVSCLRWDMLRHWGASSGIRTCETSSQASAPEHKPQPGTKNMRLTQTRVRKWKTCINPHQGF